MKSILIVGGGKKVTICLLFLNNLKKVKKLIIVGICFDIKNMSTCTVVAILQP